MPVNVVNKIMSELVAGITNDKSRKNILKDINLKYNKFIYFI